MVLAPQHRLRARRRHAVGRLPRGRPPVRRDAAHGPSRARGRPLPERVRGHATLLAEPGQPADRPARPHARHRRQHRASEPRAADVPTWPASGRVPDRLLRQVAHGQRRQPASGVHALGGPAGAGRSDRPPAERRRPGHARPGVRDRRPDGPRGKVHPGVGGPAVPRLSRPQGHPPQHRPEERRQHRAGGGTAGRVRGRGPASRPVPGPDDAAASEPRRHSRG